jgi:hypothetical protein
MPCLIAVGWLCSYLVLPGFHVWTECAAPATTCCETQASQPVPPSVALVVATPAAPTAEEIAQALKENEDALAALRTAERALQASHRKLEELLRRQAGQPPAYQLPVYPVYPGYPVTPYSTTAPAIVPLGR